MSNLVNQLGLQFDEKGLIRCHGRMQNADLTEAEKAPVILPRKDVYTKLMILEAHQKTMHSGTLQTLTQIRRKYWIVKGRASVKTVIRQCLVCKQVDVGAYAAPRMPS
ncbi:MAG: hypothetical protein GY696_11610 [Gammaproteobacteria bacterium]|nr:hypothetical protein [Gammaproteobacteria bacterium]